MFYLKGQNHKGDFFKGEAMKKIGLLLEGGGMKGIFTAGVLDYFLEKELEFGAIIGVSAGAIQACSFLSKQKYRSRDIILTYVNDKRYYSWNSWRKTGDLFNVKFAYYEIPDKLNPFDHKTFKKSKTKLLICATDVVKGKPKYFHVKNFDNGEIEILRASASLPLVANNVKIRGKEYLDGGMSDSLPLKKLEAEGYEKNVVILTKAPGYKKRKSKLYLLAKLKYKKHPKLVERIKNRYKDYNEALEYVMTQEKANKAFIIAPSKNHVSRLEKNIAKLELAYQDGYETAKRIYPDLIKFMGS